MRRFTLAAAMSVIIALGAVVLGTRSETHADEPSNDLAASFTTAHKWTGVTRLEVFWNWDGGPCVLPGTADGPGADRSGPASSTVTTDLARQALAASLQDINSRLGGTLELVDAGRVSRDAHCSYDATRPIVVGFGAVSRLGATSTVFKVKAKPEDPAEVVASRIFVSNTADFACTGEPRYRLLQTTMTRGLLVALGLGLSTDPGAIMFRDQDCTNAKTVMQADDIAGLAQLYPPKNPPTATPAPTAPSSLTITPNGLFVAGVNSVVVQGSSPAAAVASQIASASGRPVLALWLLAAGQWSYYLPALPTVGSLTQFAGPLASVFAVLQ